MRFEACATPNDRCAIYHHRRLIGVLSVLGSLTCELLDYTSVKLSIGTQLNFVFLKRTRSIDTVNLPVLFEDSTAWYYLIFWI